MRDIARRMLAALLIASLALPIIGAAAAAGHERCVVNGAVVQVIANGQGDGDPAGYSTNPQGRDRGIRLARDRSPAIANCPED